MESAGIMDTVKNARCGQIPLPLHLRIIPRTFLAFRILTLCVSRVSLSHFEFLAPLLR